MSDRTSKTTDRAILEEMLTKAKIEHADAGYMIEATDKHYNSVWFVFDANDSLKEIMSSGQ